MAAAVFKGTPGAWAVGPGFVVTNGKFALADIFGKRGEVDANASAIAQVPAMIAALVGVRDASAWGAPEDRAAAMRRVVEVIDALRDGGAL